MGEKTEDGHPISRSSRQYPGFSTNKQSSGDKGTQSRILSKKKEGIIDDALGFQPRHLLFFMHYHAI
jgi:hypothetical protein